MKLLLGYDGSDCSETTLMDLAYAGLPEDVEVHVLSVADTFIPEVQTAETAVHPLMIHQVTHAHAHATRALERAHSQATRAREQLTEAHPNWKVTASVVADAPAWALVTAVEDMGIDLLVVGSHGYGMFDRFLLGSVSQKVLTEARCSVRIVRRTPRTDTSARRIILGYDGSDDANTALDALLARAWPEGTEVHIISAVDLRMITAISYLSVFVDELLTATEEEDHAIIKRLSDQAVEKLRAAGLIAKSLTAEGDPKKMILKHAEEWQADMIFLGAHGTTRTERFLIGSVSSSVAARAHCTVEVVRSKHTSPSR
jgi:nucleotide-binding universal stress UspA family protein